LYSAAKILIDTAADRGAAEAKKKFADENKSRD
jgi:hypothetical protein